MDPALWPDVIGRLLRREDLPDDLIAQAMAVVLSGDATDAQIAAFAVGLRAKGETSGELAALVRTMLEFADHVDLDDVDGPLVDTCGTGGDGAGTINVSTMAAIVTAAAGARVAKHGGRAASSKCGSVDVLETLGVVIDLGPEGVARCVRDVGIGFCFAQRFHPAMRFAAPVRSQLGTPTTFNFLGPLANPAGALRRTVGVSDPVMAERVVRTLAVLGVERALVFFGHDGLDELTVTTTSTVYELEAGDVRIYDVDPADVGIAHAPLGALAGGDAAGNAQAVHQVFAGAQGPIHDIVTLNAAAAMVVGDVAPDLASGVEIARSVIDDGRAAATLEAFVRVSVAARESGAGLMARALECPACGHRHRLDTIPASGTFRCEQCGQVLKAPAMISSEPGAPPPPARGTAPPSRAGVPAPAAPPARRAAPPPDRDPATRDAPVRTAAGVSATVAATAAAEDANGANGASARAGRRSQPVRPAPAPVPSAAPAKRGKVHWYWRLVAWIVAVPVAFLVTAWPAYKFGFIKKDDLLDIFVGTGVGRYFRIAIVTLVWAVVTALLVQLLVEGGRARREPTPADPRRLGMTTRFRCSACGNLTRFDVVASRRTRSFHHFSVGGELSVEDEEVLDEAVEAVTCRWCGASGESIEQLDAAS